MFIMDLLAIYEVLLNHFGPQNWWPAETPFEVIVGAILTQQTAWKNAAMAIENLKQEGLLEIHTLAEAEINDIERCVRCTGFYKQKAARLSEVSKHLARRWGGDFDEFFKRELDEVREELLSLPGIGFETADAILLYASEKLTFPVDAYTFRMCACVGIKAKGYEGLRRYFEERLPREIYLYKEFHALIVELGKNYCKKSNPHCSRCPLRGFRR